MNKKALFLLIIVLLASLFAFAGCKNQQKLDIRDGLTKIEVNDTYIDNKHVIFVKYYIDPAKYDVTTFNSVQIETWVVVLSNTGNDKGTYKKTFSATIADDATPTEEGNYVTIELSGKKYRNDYHLGNPLGVTALVDATGSETDKDTIPSIFNTILIGVGLVIGGLLIYWLALALTGNKYIIAIAFVIPIILVITSYFAWGVVRGIILTAFYVVYYILLGKLNQRIADEM